MKKRTRIINGETNQWETFSVWSSETRCAHTHNFFFVSSHYNSILIDFPYAVLFWLHVHNTTAHDEMKETENKNKIDLIVIITFVFLFRFIRF